MRMTKLADEFLAPPRILHPWPNVRDEPDPVITLGMRGEPVFGGSFGVGGAQTRSSRVPPTRSSDRPVVDWGERI
jgi:hypothetical protein